MAKPQAIIVPVTPFQQNCTILWDSDSKETAVIDPGGDVEDIIEALRSQTLRPTQILLTHGHIDHAGGAEALAEALQIPIIGPDKEDTFLLQALEASGRQ